MEFTLFFLVALIILKNGYCQNSFNTSQYYQMPAVYKFDNYEECLGIYENDALYCVVNTFIKPNYNSELYNYIHEFSKNRKQHFRHDKLQRGLCVNICRKSLENLRNAGEKYFVEKFPMDSKLNFEFIHNFNAKEQREMYDKIVNKCINIELVRKFNLSGYSEIEYCIEGNARPPLDWLEILTAAIFAAIFLLVVTSSLYDRCLRNSISKDANEHYKKPLALLHHRVLTLFSLRRNWNILAAPTKPEVKDFRFIQGARALTMIGVVVGHCAWYSVILPSYNPIFVEEIYSNVASMLVVNGINIVQSFFVIGGFLTSFFLLTHLEKDRTPGVIIFLKAFVLRYIRFAPLLALTILMHATWLYRAGSGPVWDKVNYGERQFCRENWWINMLFLDNYLNVEMKCLIHSWYLATDFWLSALAVLVTLVIQRKPALKVCIFTLIFVVAAFITGAVTYLGHFEPITIFSPETLRNQHFQANETDLNYFKDFYAPTHMNIGNYFIGVFVGVTYFGLKKQGKDLGKLCYLRVIFYLCFLIGVLNILSAYFFYTYDFKKPSIFIALAAVVLKHAWGVIVGFGIFGALYRYGWFLPNVFNYSGWRIIGRISYATFMCHFFILKVLMSGVHQPMYLSVFNVMTYVCAVYGVSNLVGLALTLAVDIPIGSICKLLFLKRDS